MAGNSMNERKTNMAIIEAEPINEVTGNYEAVRFNAMKHGILSRLAVLAHEDHSEFADLLAALIDEHRPGGMTERHLIEELATIIWRKRRVLLAEGAKINEGLKSAVNSAASVIKSAAPFPAWHRRRECRPAGIHGWHPRRDSRKPARRGA
jgi:hypothetical protein